MSSPSAGQPRKQPNQFTGWLSFRRIIDISFEACVAALESWQLTGHDSELHVGQSLLRGPVEHDSCFGTYRIEVGLARGPLRPLMHMRLDIDRWSWSPSRTALELIPCRRARPTATYFRAGHLLLDSLTHSLTRQLTAQRFDTSPSKPATHAEQRISIEVFRAESTERRRSSRSELRRQNALICVSLLSFKDGQPAPGIARPAPVAAM